MPPFCFCAENDFESDFEIESENEFKFKIGFESDFESDFESENDFMFHVKHETESQKVHLWAENCTTAIQFCQELFSKNFLARLPPESQKEKAPEGSLA